MRPRRTTLLFVCASLLFCLLTATANAESVEQALGLDLVPGAQTRDDVARLFGGELQLGGGLQHDGGLQRDGSLETGGALLPDRGLLGLDDAVVRPFLTTAPDHAIRGLGIRSILDSAVALPETIVMLPQRTLCLAIPCGRFGNDPVFLEPSKSKLRSVLETARFRVSDAWSLQPSLRWMQAVSREELAKLRGLLIRKGPLAESAEPLVLLDLKLSFQASEQIALDVRVKNVAETPGVQLHPGDIDGRQTGQRTVKLQFQYSF
jgi:hypothetical protein